MHKDNPLVEIQIFELYSSDNSLPLRTGSRLKIDDYFVGTYFFKFETNTSITQEISYTSCFQGFRDSKRLSLRAAPKGACRDNLIWLFIWKLHSRFIEKMIFN